MVNRLPPGCRFTVRLDHSVPACHPNCTGRRYLTVAILEHCECIDFYDRNNCDLNPRLDLPCTRERPPLMQPDEMPVSPITTMYYSAPGAILPVSVSSPPDPVLDVRDSPCAAKLSEKSEESYYKCYNG